LKREEVRGNGIAEKMILPNNLEFIKLIMKTAIEDMSHPLVDKWADRLYAQGGPRAIFDFVQKKVKYIKDPVVWDTIRAPHVILRRYEEQGVTYGDCDDKTSLLAALLMNRGYPVRLVAAHHIKPGETPADYNSINHVYLEYKEGDKWIPLEPSSTTVRFGEKAASVIPLHYIYAEVGNKLIAEGDKKKVAIMVESFVATFSELRTFKKLLPPKVHKLFAEAYNEALTKAAQNPEKVVDLDKLTSAGRFLLKMWLQKVRELKLLVEERLRKVLPISEQVGIKIFGKELTWGKVWSGIKSFAEELGIKERAQQLLEDAKNLAMAKLMEKAGVTQRGEAREEAPEEAPPSPPKKEEEKKFPWWAIAAAVGGILIIVLLLKK